MRHLLTGFACRTAETALPDAKDGHDRGEQQHSGEFDDDRGRERFAADDAAGRYDLRERRIDGAGLDNGYEGWGGRAELRRPELTVRISSPEARRR